MCVPSLLPAAGLRPTLFPMNEPEDRYFESSRLNLHYVVWGDESKPAVVLVHGGRDHARSWDFVVQGLLDRYCCYAIDLRGHGDSDWAIGAQYRASDHVADLSKFLDVLDRGPAQIVAHSMGGRVTLDLAGAFPDRVHKLVIIEGFGWQTRTDNAPGARLANLVRGIRDVEGRKVHPYATLDDAVARMADVNKRLTPAMARHLTEHAVRRREDGRYVWKFDNFTRIRALPDFSIDEVKDLWAGITAPILVISGSDTHLPMSIREEFAGVLQDARLVTVSDAGHWVHHDQLDQFLTLCREFLD